MVVLGIVLLIVGLLVPAVHVLLWVGVALIVVGLVLNLVPISGTRRRVF
jgi:membrane protein implicated in regulation of membrane protease activity